jgi:phospholipase/carboxylesterase
MDILRTGERDGAARLSARPRKVCSVSSGGPGAGLRALDLGGGPEVLLYVPPSAEAGRVTLVLALHGAGGNAQGGLAPLLPLADSKRLLLLAPTAQDRTWDVIRGGWGPDVRRIDGALEEVFASYPVDAARIAVSGFSDGATYALSLGLANADLLTHVIAFSPGFVAPGARVGTPQVFITHGRDDTVLPIDHTTRRIVPRLRADGVPTEVREFDGAHAVPAAMAADAVDWLFRTSPLR